MELSIKITEEDFIRDEKLFVKLKELLNLNKATDRNGQVNEGALKPEQPAAVSAQCAEQDIPTSATMYTAAAPTLSAPIIQPTPTAPTAPAAEYTLEQLSLAAAPLMDAGKTNELIGLLNNTFGVATLQQLPREKYNDFATAVRGMGAQI